MCIFIFNIVFIYNAFTQIHVICNVQCLCISTMYNTTYYTYIRRDM